MDTLKTAGIAVPRLGLGTYRMQGDECRTAVLSALRLGYRHIDTAEMYGNEAAVGEAIAASGVARSEIHLTTKVWHEHLTPDAIRRACDASLTRLRQDYVDFYLVHWPSPSMDLGAVMETMTQLREEGRARAIGVCNFPVALLRSAVEDCGAEVACDQVEHHALLGQRRLRDYAASKGVPITAYCPLAQGRLAEQPTLAQIGRKHGASAAQVAIAWLLGETEVMAIPKSRSERSQRANLEAASLKLDEEDRAAIAALPKDVRCVQPAFAPEWDPAG